VTLPADPAIDPLRRQPIATVFTAESDAVIGLKTIPEEHPLHVPIQKHRRNFAEEDFASPSDSSVSSSSAASVASADDEETSESSLSEVEESYSEKAGLLRSEEKLELRMLPFVSLVARLYEAHLLMGHMMLLVALRIFTASPSKFIGAPVSIVPMLTGATLRDSAAFVEWAYLLTDRMRTISLLFSIIMFIFYDRYHQQAVKYRWQVGGNRLGVQSSDRSERPFPMAMVDFLAMPAGVVYGIIPILHAQFMHLFTDRLVYKVSFKPKGNDHRRPDLEKGVMA